MKRKRNLLPEVPAFDPDAREWKDKTPEWCSTRGAYVLAFGPRCAAWLVWKFRKTLHRYGAFRMYLPPEALEPPYLQIAIEYLARRECSLRWSVRTTWDRGTKHYRVEWLRRRSIPVALVPVGSC